MTYGWFVVRRSHPDRGGSGSGSARNRDNAEGEESSRGEPDDGGEPPSAPRSGGAEDRGSQDRRAGDPGAENRGADERQPGDRPDDRGRPRERRSSWIFSEKVSPLVSGQLPRRIGRYELLEVLGDGAMGVVVSARDTRDGSVVAIKLLRPELIGKVSESRFARELEILQRLDHPGIARVLDYGHVDTPLGSLPWLALELVQGEDFITDADRRNLDLVARVEQWQRIAAAVGAAHQAGFIHRDLKEENIRVDADGNPKVLDFGIASVIQEIASGDWDPLTGSDELLGTFETLSPEQVAGKPVGPASDVYALGIIGGVLLTGRTPYQFSANQLPRLLQEIRDGELGEIGVWHEKLPEPLFRLLLSCVSVEPEDRPQNGTALAAEIEEILPYLRSL